MRYGELVEMEQIRRLIAEEGHTAKDVSEKLEMPYTAVLRLAKKAGVELSRGRPKGAVMNKEMVSRNAEMARRYVEGETLQSIGDDYGITRERVRQIVNKEGVFFDEISDDLVKIRFLDSITDEEHDALRAYQTGDLSMSEIADKRGLCANRLNKIKQTLGIETHHRFRYHPDRDRRIREIPKLYTAGVPIDEIVERFDLHATEHVYYYLKQAGVDMKKHRRSASLEGQKDEVIAAIQSGLNDREVSEKFDASEAGVWKFRMRHGLMKRKKK